MAPTERAFGNGLPTQAAPLLRTEASVYEGIRIILPEFIFKVPGETSHQRLTIDDGGWSSRLTMSEPTTNDHLPRHLTTLLPRKEAQLNCLGETETSHEVHRVGGHMCEACSKSFRGPCPPTWIAERRRINARNDDHETGLLYYVLRQGMRLDVFARADLQFRVLTARPSTEVDRVPLLVRCEFGAGCVKNVDTDDLGKDYQ